MKPVRFLPLVALAAFFLLALKLTGLMMGEGYMLTGSRQTLAKAVDKTQPDKQPAPQKEANKSADLEKPAAANTPASKSQKIPKDITSLSEGKHRSKAEVLLLTSLAKRREQLDKRERELGLRLNLIKAAEKRIDERITVLKGLEVKIQRFAKAQKEQKKEHFGRLVKMYTSMKPKNAARIFNELDNKVLLGIIKSMKPQAMSTILAAMAPVKAREMTIALAGNARQKVTEQSLDALPKINGN